MVAGLRGRVFWHFFGSIFKHDFWSKIAFKILLRQKQGQRRSVLKFPGTNFTNIVDFWPWTPVSQKTTKASYKAKSIHLLKRQLLRGRTGNFPVLRSGEIDFWKKSRSEFFQKIDCERNFSFAIDFLKKLARDFFQKSIYPPEYKKSLTFYGGENFFRRKKFSPT